MKYLSKLIIGLAFGLLCVASYFIISWLNFLYSPLLSNTREITYIVTPGSSLNQLAHELQAKGLLKKPKYLIALGYLKQQTKNIQAGEYAFIPGSKPQKWLAKLTNGKVIQHSLAVIEGWTFNHVKRALADNPNLDHQLGYVISVNDLMVRLSKTDQSPEGLFFPDTYHFARGTSDIDLLQRAYAVMQQKLQLLWSKRNSDLPYKTPYEALIAASLVEKESALPSERPIIAGVIVNRLRKNMLLQIDPTVIYGLGEKHKGELSKQDLQSDTPYNTYRKRGLPPTPIALPSEQSIKAALHPTKTNYLYFVAKGDGSHHFSETLQEQQRAIKKYLHSQSEQPSKPLEEKHEKK